ncbi:MAG TPA: preprotein translocase subunit TatB [Natronosporangium sp.]|nr:preprotein translocase subunit TatB [Natronosporangium sp.]
MFNLNWYNVVILLLLALFIFGDKLPKVVSDGLRILRQLRQMAQNATNDLNRELGTDLRLEDLHPKTFVRRHLLSEQEQERLLAPIRQVTDEVVQQTRAVQEEIREVGQRAQSVAGGAASAAGRAASHRGRATEALAAADEPSGGNDPESAPGQAAPIRPRVNYDDVI